MIGKSRVFLFIGQYFKGKDAEGSTAHLVAHAVLGAAVAAAGGNDALAGGLAAAGAEATAPIVSKWLYGKDAKDLTADEKATVSAIAGLTGAATGVAVGGSMADVAQGNQAGHTAVDNNYLTAKDWKNYKNKISACGGDNSDKLRCYKKAKEELYNESKKKNKALMSACSENGNIDTCQALITEADEARDISKKALDSFGVTNPAKPLPAFINYYDVPWASNPSIHYWVGTIDLSAFGLSANAAIAVNNVTGDVFLGYSAGLSAPISRPSAGASLSIGTIMNNLSSIEKANLGKTINNTLAGTSSGGNICGYFTCIGTNKTPDTIEKGEKKPGKVSFEFGIGTGVSTSGSFQNSNMIPIGKVLK
ncbi:MAG: VENN motif pre-toxin domain-containing protein [Snodgrassella sp.]|nr:VENN motif pre-toxin domain-containing protein [Snodgrassella sp.]